MILETILAPLLSKLGGSLIDRIFPNEAERDKAKLELLKLQQQGDIQKIISEANIAVGQLAVNAEEAKSGSFFKSGWRPAVGWVCVFGLIYSTIGVAFFNLLLGVLGLPLFPPVDTQTLMTILFGMLGLGYYRTKEKISEKA